MWEKCLLSYRFTQHTVQLCASERKKSIQFQHLICFFCLFFLNNNKASVHALKYLYIFFLRLSDGGHKGLLPKPNQEPASHLTGGGLESNFSDLPPIRKSSSSPAGPSQHFPDRSILTDLSSNAKNKGTDSLRPPSTRLDKYKCLVAAAFVSTSQGGAGVSQSPIKDTVSKDAPIHAPVSWKDLEHSKGPEREEETQLETILPPPPSPPLVSPAHLTPPSMERQRSPSPHFAPQRLTDKPPVSVSQQDEATGR